MKEFLNLIRALFPQWDFFDRVSYHFELYYQMPNKQNWEKWSFQQSRPQWGLLFNAKTNMALAQVHIVEKFVREIQELNGQQFEHLSSFKMLQSMLGGTQVKFKIVGVSGEERVEVFNR